jgi:hypothetical protein
MLARYIVRRLAAVLGLFALCASSVAFDYSQFRCQFDQIARPACCCPKKAAEEPRTAISQSGCCDVESFHFTAAPSESQRAPSVVATFELPQPIVVVHRSAAAVERELDLRVAGPPLILLKHSFLI